MKKISVRILSIFLVVVMLFSSNSIMTLATTDVPMSIIVSSESVLAGSTVDVTISLKNNPGISSLKLNVAYDNILTLTDIKYNKEIGGQSIPPQKMSSPITLTWVSPFENFEGNATFATLTFTVDESAEEDDVANIRVSYNQDDIYNMDEINVECTVVNGKVTVLSCIPGDINGDQTVNNKDITRMFQYLAGWDVTVNETTLDVNGDGSVNNKDLTRLFQYIANWDVEIFCIHTSTKRCIHEMIMTEAVDATCTKEGNEKYYNCSVCGKYFSDANGLTEIFFEDTVIEAKGHNVVVDPAVEPTETSSGWTEGSHCDICGEVLVEQNEIEPLQTEEYAITYYLYNNDSYLQEVGVENPNDSTYSPKKGITPLKEPVVAGYIFEGWYDGQGSSAKRITEIPIGSTGNKVLYARWTVETYEIQFDSPLVPVEDLSYTVDKGRTLATPSMFGYTFMGWSDSKGNIINRIKPGEYGDKTLTANWTSNRNQTKPVEKLGDPIIYEDAELEQYLFVYEIGQIENVPLYQIKYLGNQVGITVEESISESGTIVEGYAKSIVNAVSNATTKTSAWTLSKEWNDSLAVSKVHYNETGTEIGSSLIEISDDSSVSITGKEGGGSTSTTNSSGISAKISSEMGVDNDLTGVKATVSAEGGVEEKMSDTEGRTWNDSESYENSKSSSTNKTTSSVISSKISEEYGYHTTHTEGGSESTSDELEVSESTSNEYGSSLTYSTETTYTNVKSYSNANAPEGYYRIVCAGTVHVFAVVGYDIKTKSYFVYNYSVIDDDVKDYIDYSKDTSQFNDYENGILPFEIPYFVNEYIDDVVNGSKGLEVDIQTGKITSYNGKDKDVVIPRYITVTNKNENGTIHAVKVTGIESSVFAGKADITSVQFPDTVTEIPEGAFANCTSLRNISCPSLVKIGKNAFNGCLALDEFTISSKVTEIGENAFGDTPKVKINAANSEVVLAASNIGAKRIIVDLSSLTDKLQNVAIYVPNSTEYFEINGKIIDQENEKYETYRGVQIISDATITSINTMNFNDNKIVPLKISSDKVILSGVSIDAANYALILLAETTTVELLGNTHIETDEGNAILCKNIILEKQEPSVASSLNVTGNIYVCGTIENENYLKLYNGKVIYINKESFEEMEHDSIEWVLESEMPEGAYVLEEKWTYDLTTNITSGSPEVPEGYTMYKDPTWVWTPWGPWSEWSDTPVSASDSRQVETRTVEASRNYKTVYHYHRWAASYYGGSSGYGGASGNMTNYYTYDTDSPLEYWQTVTGYNVYKFYYSGGWFSVYGSNPYTTQEVVSINYKTQYRYRDRSKIYTYYYTKTESLESDTEVTESDPEVTETNIISNVQKWVKYCVE